MPHGLKREVLIIDDCTLMALSILPVLPIPKYVRL